MFSSVWSTIVLFDKTWERERERENQQWRETYQWFSNLVPMMHIDHIYCWFISPLFPQSYRDSERQYYIDGGDERTSNWLRFLNCPRHVKEQNVKALECLGKLFYVTIKDVYPGEELLIYYGDVYAEKELGIDVERYFDMDTDIMVCDNSTRRNTTSS